MSMFWSEKAQTDTFCIAMALHWILIKISIKHYFNTSLNKVLGGKMGVNLPLLDLTKINWVDILDIGGC